MCNLYSSARSQDEIRRTFAVDRDEAGNLPPLPGIFPDQMAPVVHSVDGARVLTMMRWGLPPPPEGRHPAGHQRSQRRLALLAALAQACTPLPGAGDLVQRVRRHEATQDAGMVRP
ncbi:protein of unknown function DUF159 (plasmid) [Methylobacterium aquaticum]|uniref:DUF159 family protein n=1 Tax=Methylobacterium aquaticum TaxID=270351 RepID=A0A0C6F8N8_9HYPH|nr:protein of unknown function DUF159 [Methylobacterium aquaticum]